MVIHVTSPKDAPMIHKIIFGGHNDAIVFAMGTDAPMYAEIKDSLLGERPDTPLILLTPEEHLNMFGGDPEFAKYGLTDVLAFYRNGERTGWNTCALFETEEDGAWDKFLIGTMLNNFLPPIEYQQDSDADKLEKIKKLREYVAKKYPHACCAVNAPGETYGELLHEVSSDFMYFAIGLCGCGCTDGTVEAICDYLEIAKMRHDLSGTGQYSSIHGKMKERFGHDYVSDDPILQFMAYILDDIGLTEHGTSINGAWITETGTACLEALKLYLEDDEDGDE